MSQSSQNCLKDRNRRNTFIVIGGVVACATALAAVFGLPDVLRGDESHSDNHTSIAALGSKVSNEAQSIQINSTDLPTSKPTQQLRKYTPNSTFPADDDAYIASATRNLNLFADEVSIRLKLYWQRGYYWQEEIEEKWWCMACAGTCRTGGNVKVRDCKQKSSADATFVVKGFNVPPNSGYQYRIAKTNLCLQTSLPNITLSPCKINEPRQLFTSKPSAKFDIRPIKSTDRCLTQHHHPRADELIYAEHCSIAHKTTTGYWTAY